MVSPIKNWHNEKTRSENQAKIVKAIYDDNDFEFMTYKELLDVTGLKKPTLSHHLRELCQEMEREPYLYPELSHILSKHPELQHVKPGDSVPIRELLRTPILITKRGVYRLHPMTKWALDRGIYPEIAQDRKTAWERAGERPRNHPKKGRSEKEAEPS